GQHLRARRAGDNDLRSVAGALRQGQLPALPRERALTADAKTRPGDARYARESKRRVRWRKRKVKSGHMVVLRPLSVRYQLLHPDFQTAPALLLSSSRLNAACASACTSSVDQPLVRICRNASRM